jgi:peptide/nickel transport system permease protein
MIRFTATALLIVLAAAFLGAGWIAPSRYDTQFREVPDSAPCSRFLLGTDSVGRDRLSRLLYAGRVSFVSAPAAAAISCLIALLAALAGESGNRIASRVIAAGSDLCLSVPWIFALLAARACLPLNASPEAIILLTYGLLGVLGWAAPARVLLASVKRQQASGFALQARAAGCPEWRLAAIHVVPNVLPIVWAQFLIAVPVFLLTEANLGLLGLGVPEPIPSLGGMLRDMENVSRIPAHPELVIPALLLIVMVGAFHVLAPTEERSM